jgi:hypothetical protein
MSSAEFVRPAPATAALFNASGSENSHRGPYHWYQEAYLCPDDREEESKFIEECLLLIDKARAK